MDLYAKKLKANQNGTVIKDFDFTTELHHDVQLFGKYVVKREKLKDGEKSESDIYNAITGDNKCEAIPVKQITTITPDTGHVYYVMKRYSGDISRLNLHTDLKKISVVLEIAEDIKCLADQNYFFTDLKRKNVFFCAYPSKPIQYFLGDLGSMRKDKDDEYTSTYPPPEYRYDPPSHVNNGFIKFKSNEQMNKVLSWQVAMLLMEMIDPFFFDRNFLYSQNIFDLRPDPPTTKIVEQEHLGSHHESIINFLKQYLFDETVDMPKLQNITKESKRNFLKDKRPTLEKAIEELKTIKELVEKPQKRKLSEKKEERQTVMRQRIG